MTKNGLVPNVTLIYNSTKKRGGEQKNIETFNQWFIEKLIPNIPNNSIIVLDDAEHYNLISASTRNSSKAQILSLLEKNKYI